MVVKFDIFGETWGSSAFHPAGLEAILNTEVTFKTFSDHTSVMTGWEKEHCIASRRSILHPLIDKFVLENPQKHQQLQTRGFRSESSSRIMVRQAIPKATSLPRVDETSRCGT